MKVIFNTVMRNYSHCKEADIPYQPTLGDVLEYLSTRWPRFRKRLYNWEETELRRDVAIVVNDIFVLDHNTKLDLTFSPDDVLSFFELPAYG